MITRNIRRIKTFVVSLLFHIYAGFPKSSKEQILYRFNICQQCDMHDTKLAQCLACGCNINNRKIFMNKLAWADQECPLKKWEKIK
jgi:hypothetical protein